MYCYLLWPQPSLTCSQTLTKSVAFESPCLTLQTVRWLTTSEAICLAISFRCFPHGFVMEQSCDVLMDYFTGTGNMLFPICNLVWDTKPLLLLCVPWCIDICLGMLSNLCSFEPLAAVLTWRTPTCNWAHQLSIMEEKTLPSSPKDSHLAVPRGECQEVLTSPRFIGS